MKKEILIDEADVARNAVAFIAAERFPSGSSDSAELMRILREIEIDKGSGVVD
jgi:hypothetical protein